MIDSALKNLTQLQTRAALSPAFLIEFKFEFTENLQAEFEFKFGIFNFVNSSSVFFAELMIRSSKFN